MNRLCVTILAGGIGKRMASDLPKVLHKVAGMPMIVKVLQEVHVLNPSRILVVVGRFYDLIKSEIETFIQSNIIEYIRQDEPLGTGDAVKSTLPYLDSSITNIILNGDVPLLSHHTISSIYNNFTHQQSQLMITSISLEDPTGNGRIIRDVNGDFLEIVEERDCNLDQKKIKLVNCGIYIATSDVLHKYIPCIKNENSQSEYYLTDLVKIYRNATNQKIDLYILKDHQRLEISNVNTKQQLIDLEKELTVVVA